MLQELETFVLHVTRMNLKDTAVGMSSRHLSWHSLDAAPAPAAPQLLAAAAALAAAVLAQALHDQLAN